MKKTLIPIAIALAFGAAAPAFAQSKGDWTLGVGVHQVNPKSDNGTLAGGTLPLDIDSDVKPTITFEYFLRDNLGLEVLAALPFKHDIAVDGVGTVGSTKHLPPTVSLQYHFNSKGKVSPFLGAGLNYMIFYSGKDKNGFDVDIDNGFGYALQAGVDVAVQGPWSANVDVKKVFFDTDASINGGALKSKVKLDPWVVSAGFGYKF